MYILDSFLLLSLHSAVPTKSVCGQFSDARPDVLALERKACHWQEKNCDGAIPNHHNTMIFWAQENNCNIRKEHYFSLNI